MEIHSLKCKWLSEVWWLKRERNTPGASVFSIVLIFSFLSIFLLFSSLFFLFLFLFVFLFPPLFHWIPYFSSFLFPFLLSFLFFYHCFRPDVKSLDLSWEKKFLFGVKYTTYAVVFDVWDQYQKSAGQADHSHWMWLPQFGIISPASLTQCGLQALLHQHTQNTPVITVCFIGWQRNRGGKTSKGGFLERQGSSKIRFEVSTNSQALEKQSYYI